MKKERPLVVIESPFAPRDGFTVDDNIKYARRALKDSLLRGEAPIASHLLHTQDGVLDDTKPDEREMGIEAGLAWLPFASCSAVYVDHGFSRGMQFGVERAMHHGVLVHFRSINGLSEEDVQARVPEKLQQEAMMRSEAAATAVLAIMRPAVHKHAEIIASSMAGFIEREVLITRDGKTIKSDEVLATVAAALRISSHFARMMKMPWSYFHQLSRLIVENADS